LSADRRVGGALRRQPLAQRRLAPAESSNRLLNAAVSGGLSLGHHQPAQDCLSSPCGEAIERVSNPRFLHCIRQVIGDDTRLGPVEDGPGAVGLGPFHGRGPGRRHQTGRLQPGDLLLVDLRPDTARLTDCEVLPKSILVNRLGLGVDPAEAESLVDCIAPLDGRAAAVLLPVHQPDGGSRFVVGGEPLTELGRVPRLDFRYLLTHGGDASGARLRSARNAKNDLRSRKPSPEVGCEQVFDQIRSETIRPEIAVEPILGTKRHEQLTELRATLRRYEDRYGKLEGMVDLTKARSALAVRQRRYDRLVAEYEAVRKDKEAMESEIDRIEEWIVFCLESVIEKAREDHAEGWSPTAVLGYRLWAVGKDGLHGVKMRWPGPTLEATCLSRGGDSEIPHTDGRCGRLGCGVYASKTVDPPCTPSSTSRELVMLPWGWWHSPARLLSTTTATGAPLPPWLPWVRRSVPPAAAHQRPQVHRGRV
jgi:hypothetical protein